MAYDPNNAEAEANAQQERMQAFRSKYKGESNLQALVRAMQAAQRRKEALEQDLKNANAEFDVLRFEAVPELMDTQGVERVSYEGIGRVSLTADLRIQTFAAARSSLFEWLTTNKLGDLITETVNPSTLKAWVKNRLKEGKELPPSELLRVTPITRASITKG